MVFKKRRKRFYKPKSSQSEKLFIELLEQKYNVQINKQFKLYGRYYDGQYKNYLFELDGNYWHSKLKQLKIDHKKNINALKKGYLVIRIELNNKEEIYKVFEDNKQLLEEIFLKK